MMRCPECGFRAEDKTCPLCGVRMQTVSSTSRVIQTHAHRQTGEKCALPNQKQLVRQQQEKKTSAGKAPPKLMQVIFFIIIAVLLRACFGD